MVMPYLIVSGATRAIAFYRDVFGATELVRLAQPDGKIAHADLKIGDGHIMLADEFPDMGYRSPTSLGGSPVSLYLVVDDVDAVFARALAAGAKELMPVSDQFDGDRRGTLADPFGHVWLLSTPGDAIDHAELARRFKNLSK